MRQNKPTSQSSVSLPLPPAMTITLLLYLLMSVGLAYVMPILPLLGIVGAIVINLIVLFFLRSRYALPLYVLAAGPSTALSFVSSGILSRLYIGNLLFVFVCLIWILQVVLPERKSGRTLLTTTLLVPLLGLILVGLISIIYSRVAPDPNVPYTYPHSNVSVTVTNLSEMSLLVGLPMFLLVVPGLVRNVLNARLVTTAYLIAGAIYAGVTMVAAPLGLLSTKHIIGIDRPLVFGESSSGLGSLIVLFANIAFSKALYTKDNAARAFWLLLTAFYGVGVIMALGREAWIGLFLSSLVILVIRTKNPAALLILLVPLALLFIPGATNFFDPTQAYGSDRVKIALDAINIWLHSPIFGIGAGNFQFFDRVYGIDKVGLAHNQFLSVLAEMGIQGLIFLIWLMIAVGVVSARYFRRSKSDLAKSISLSYIGFFTSIVFGGLFTGIFIPSAAAGGGTSAFVEASYRWLLLGLVLSIPNWDQEALLAEQQASAADVQAAQQTKQGNVATATWA